MTTLICTADNEFFIEKVELMVLHIFLHCINDAEFKWIRFTSCTW